MNLPSALYDGKGLGSVPDVVPSKEGRFIYCMVERGEEAYPFTGLEGAKLETISYGKIAAVVSALKTTDFDLLSKEAVIESIFKHQEINRRVFQSHTVVPVRFGTIADDPRQVRDLLRKVYLQVKAALKRLEGKIELVVRASWDPKAVIEDVRSEISIAAPSAIGLEEKIAIGRQVFEAIEARKRAVAETIHRDLRPLAVDFSLHDFVGEKMIFDCSYLVEREQEAFFDEALNCLAKEFHEKLTFKYIGPLPPYSFTRLEVTQGNFEVVDEARKTLGLPEKASIEEIKACYRRLSMACHPDRNPDDPSAEERFRNVVQAYEVLEAYCENNPWLAEGRFYSFTREDVENAVMVRDGSA